MDTARALGAEPHGTVITADFQEAGRGRQSRSWIMDRGKNLIFTILLRYGELSSIPEALTLRAGLAVSLAVEDLVPALEGQVKVKWPNDVMIGSRKIAGILTESDGKTVCIGIGVNVTQKEFPEEFEAKAGSIIQFFPLLSADPRFILLEKFLSRFYDEITSKGGLWRERILKRLYKLGKTVVFAEGAASSNTLVEGILSGIGPLGELLIIPKGEDKEKAFVTGELRVY